MRMKGGKRLKRFIKRGQKGFTLIELLVVVAILGTLAAVAIPNVIRFVGAGAVEAANTEAHNVQTAVVAYMVDMNLTVCDGTVGPLVDIPTTPPTPPDTSVKSFFTGSLQAIYTILNGEITAATSKEIDGVVGSKWADLTYTVGVGWHEPDPGP